MSVVIKCGTDCVGDVLWTLEGENFASSISYPDELVLEKRNDVTSGLQKPFEVPLTLSPHPLPSSITHPPLPSLSPVLSLFGPSLPFVNVRWKYFDIETELKNLEKVSITADQTSVGAERGRGKGGNGGRK